MSYSRHYTEERKEREAAILKIGLGEVLHTEVQFRKDKNKNYLYKITSTAILIVCPADMPNHIVTMYPARPSRIKNYWKDAPKEIIDLSVKHTRMGLVF